MKETIDFNINNTVYVKLTDLGVCIMKAKHKEMQSQHVNYNTPFIEKEVDEDGFSTWQMWDLMSMFGSNIVMGLTLPFETDIRLESN